MASHHCLCVSSQTLVLWVSVSYASTPFFTLREQSFFVWLRIRCPPCAFDFLLLTALFQPRSSLARSTINNRGRGALGAESSDYLYPSISVLSKLSEASVILRRAVCPQVN